MSGFRSALALSSAFLLASQALGCALEPSSGEALGRSERPLVGGTVTTGDPAVAALTYGGKNAFCTATLVRERRPHRRALHRHGRQRSKYHCILWQQHHGRGNPYRDRKKIPTPASGPATSAAATTSASCCSIFPTQIPSLRCRSIPPPSRYISAPPIATSVSAYSTARPATRMAASARAAPPSPEPKRMSSTAVTTAFLFALATRAGRDWLVVDDVEYVTGVHSFTSGSDCHPPNGDTRVDTYASDVLTPWIEENDPVCGADGTCAPIGCQNDPDCQPCGRNGECTSGCALPDPDCADGELGDICQARQPVSERSLRLLARRFRLSLLLSRLHVGGRLPRRHALHRGEPLGSVCYFSGAPAGLLGDACSEDVECGTYICTDDQCVRPCDLSKGMGCPSSFECRADDDSTGYFCFGPPVDDGGCRTAAGRAWAASSSRWPGCW